MLITTDYTVLHYICWMNTCFLLILRCWFQKQSLFCCSTSFWISFFFAFNNHLKKLPQKHDSCLHMSQVTTETIMYRKLFQNHSYIWKSSKNWTNSCLIFMCMNDFEDIISCLILISTFYTHLQSKCKCTFWILLSLKLKLQTFFVILISLLKG